jgi:hypothetical protein
MTGRTRGALAALALAIVAPAWVPTLEAQPLSPACESVVEAQDACQKVADLFAFLTPQLGATIAGGNPTLGQGGNLGAFGRLSFGVRFTGVRGHLPRPEPVAVRPGPAQQSAFPLSDQWFGLPQVDVSLGLTSGIPLAVSNVGGIDLLASGSWLPEVQERDVTLRATRGRFRLGFGARLGILQESATSPGISVTYLRRALPNADLTARPGDDTLQVLGARVRADSWRLVASRHLAALGVAAGVGQDRIDARASVSAVVNEGPVRVALGTPEPFRETLTRTNAFANLSLNIAILRLVGEVGRTWGGSVTTYNSFAGASPTDPRLYGSVGLRLGF